MFKYNGLISFVLLGCSFSTICKAQAGTKIVLTNDDGWAVAQVRQEFNVFTAAGYNVVLSAPAVNKSGSGSSTATPTVVTAGCEFASCPTNAPAEGSDSSNARLNYVNAFPVDAVKFGIQTLAPKFFGTGVKPDLVVSGANIGNNLGSIGGSGTVGAASEAALEGIPSIAFSGAGGSQVSFTTLTQTTLASTITAEIFSNLALNLTNTLVKSGAPFLPPGISLNVNFGSNSPCPSASSYKFVLTRLVASTSGTDVTTCGNKGQLTDERTAIGRESCIATVSVFNASTKADVGEPTQAVPHHTTQLRIQSTSGRDLISFCIQSTVIMKLFTSVYLSLALVTLSSAQTKVVLTNDDGWAVAQIRDEYEALKAAGYDVVLSAPAVNKSGTGSSTATPTTVTSACEFNSCQSGDPAEGADPSDARINYVNAFPVDSVRYGIQTLAPKFFKSLPDLVISGSNIGNNLGSTVLISGTVGAASEAALEGIPSIAFSGASGSQVSYTTLTTQPTASSTISANIYTSLVLKFTAALLNTSGPILPDGISLNVNFASTSGNCNSASAFKFVFTRINSDSKAVDVETCGSTKLPTESSAIKKGCIATVSVFNASNKGDVNAATQQVVLNKLQSILTCL
ncbi:hypothetical protein CVT24_010787 [Panaeolus cyanescens]|uniref:Survival protein SurE-like phosphatase/nucleotidase domain-containing protein n=1 Tax=Panaeolus cyanescens TaxID=181874 RepID=A0A409VGU5_9AGAR|nr:hypothetical protein CVT24_010787 [Panaeolus cyanescens]